MLSVIIPVKNEPNLEPFLSSVHEVLADIPDTYEVLVAQGDRETKNYPYPHFPHQRTIWTYGDSLERSILNALAQLKGTKIIVMDADGSHLPEKIPEFCQALDKFEMVVGSRFIEGSQFKASIPRRFVSWGCIWLAHRAGSRLVDPMSGYFAIRKEVLNRMKFKPFVWKVGLEIELRKKPSLIEVPIYFKEREMGKSKTTVWIGIKIIWDLLEFIIQKWK